METLVINKDCKVSESYDINLQKVCLKRHLKKVYKKVLENNLNVKAVKKALRNRKTLYESQPKVKMKEEMSEKCLSYEVMAKRLVGNRFVQSLCSLMVLIIAIYVRRWDHMMSSRCVVSNNYFVMEASRPPTDCQICRNVDRFLILENTTKEEFAKYAYTGQPILVRGATHHWSALKTFSFDFFHEIYSQTPGAYESVEHECQFFPFKSEFNHLSEVFAMPEDRVRMSPMSPYSSKPWYIGWSNCNPEIASILRKHYSRPTFLPDDSESSAIDWIFMGYSQIGASMHLDYVQRPSWQAQISGSKTWHLLPPPECERECKAINITVQTGEIILIDTNQWYHDTHINPGPISITIGSEYD